MNNYAYYKYLKFDGENFFTAVLLPQKNGKFPTVISRSPYVGNTVLESEDDILKNYLTAFRRWLKRGYAIVFQHCRGTGKSTGDFVPYIYEREDGIALRKWVKEQCFFNGELYLVGESYSASAQYATAPFEKEIKGAIFEVQDSERYRLWYRNGQMRKGHANWHFGLYKGKRGLPKSFNFASFSTLPLAGLSEKALGEKAEDFEQMLFAARPEDKFWSTRFGGGETKNAVANANIPILLTTGYNDFYVGGVFKMWNQMSDQTKNQSALLVSPYNHGDNPSGEQGLCFEKGKRRERFGEDYQIDFFDNIRKGSPLPFKKGVITYYRCFENRWEEDFYRTKTNQITLPLGDGEIFFSYDPLHPTSFYGEGAYATENNPQDSFIRLFIKPSEKDIFVKGKIMLKLAVSSNCPDTSFYVRICLKNKGYSYILRHDITSLSYSLKSFAPNEKVHLDFCFDEHAFLIKKDEFLQIDITSTDYNTYVCHTNKKGEYSLQNETMIARNTVYLEDSSLIIPVE